MINKYTHFYYNLLKSYVKNHYLLILFDLIKLETFDIQ